MWDFDSLQNFLEILGKGESIRGEEIGRDTFINGNYTILIDTCFARDTSMYETAITVNNNNIVVVEAYDNPDDATIGHKSWIAACKKKSFSFYSIQTGEIFIYQ